MKLASIYNVFDGDELLLGSIKQIRDQVDVVIVVYQRESHRGNMNPNLDFSLMLLQEMNLVDHFEQYKPVYSKGGALVSQESNKRNLGLQIARQYQCTHYLHIDCDEFYLPAQFKFAKEMTESGVRNTFCHMATYFLKPTWRLTPDESYLVPFIQKLGTDNTGPHNPAPKFIVDPSRRPDVKPPYLIFHTDELLMHHFSWVRKDLGMKLRNSSANDMPGFRDQVEDMIVKCEAFKLDPTGLTPWYAAHKIIEVDNQFNINI
jgi:hypothetical protein